MPFIPSNQYSSQIVYLDIANRIVLNDPLVLVAFPDVGLIGTVALDYIIRQTAMHQIAFMESEYVMPASVFIDKQFRHPFRIYANSEGTICIVVCEAPILSTGINSITKTITEWCIRSKARELIVATGIMHELAIESSIEEDLSKRRVYLMQNYDETKDTIEKERDEHKKPEVGALKSLINEAILPTKVIEPIDIDNIKLEPSIPNVAIFT